MTTAESASFSPYDPSTSADPQPKTEFFAEVISQSPARTRPHRHAPRSAALANSRKQVGSTDGSQAGKVRDILKKHTEQRAAGQDPLAQPNVDTCEDVPQDIPNGNESMNEPNENEVIETIRKENVFGSEVTDADIDIIQKRVALQQRKFAEFERREHEQKAAKIREFFAYLSDEEIRTALKECDRSEDEVIMHMSELGYLHRLRKDIALKNMSTANPITTMSAEQTQMYEQLLKKREATLKKSTTAEAKKKYQRCGRLDLDTALRQIQQNKIDPEKAFEGWSAARIKAYKLIDTNPNSYYYRFNAPGEEQAKGGWTKQEQAMFHKRLNEIGATGQWGLFSMEIPGRVGYQCSNYYRLLIETEQIHDPNYVLDEKGKAHFLFSTTKVNKDGSIVKGKTFRTHKKQGGGSSGSGTERKTSTRTKPASAKRKRRAGYCSDDSSEESDEDFTAGETDNQFCSVSATSWATTKRSRAKLAATSSATNGEDEGTGDAEEPKAVTEGSDVLDDMRLGGEDEELEEEVDPTNPLPGFIDPITLDEVNKPAISPYGHVMSYDSWVRCLTNMNAEKRNICPLTKKPLTKRDLVVLTHENIEEYRDKIVNK